MRVRITAFISILLTFLALLQPTQLTSVKAFELDVPKWILCEWTGQAGKDIIKAARTDWVMYSMASKSSTSSMDSPRGNIYNLLLNSSGYSIGSNNDTPFTRFGLSGLKFTSYTGEWKYYDIDPCEEGDRQVPSSTNYGIFYENRKDPLSTYAELNATKDVRSIEYNRGRWSAFSKAVLDNIANTFLSISKLIVTFLLALVNLALSDISSLIGLDDKTQTSLVLKLYKGIFLPFLSLMWLMTSVYVIYYGLIKREYRQTLINGLGKPLLYMTLAIIIGLNPQFIKFPNQLSVLVQSVVVGAMTEHFSGDGKTDLCTTDFSKVSENTEDTDFLSKQSEYMRNQIGCRVWAEYLFKPFVKGQFGTEYDKLNTLANVNEEWTLKPTVKFKGKTIENWGLFHVSVMSGVHEELDGIITPSVGGVNKDWYRIVDALSNYDDKVIDQGKATSGTIKRNGSISSDGGSESSSSGPSHPTADGDAGGAWLVEGTKEHEAAKISFKILTEKYGLSGIAAAGWLGNMQGESEFQIDKIEAEDGQNYEGRGFGLVQFTPAEKYLNSQEHANRKPGLAGAVEAQLDFVMNSEFRNNEVLGFLGNVAKDHGLPPATGMTDILDTSDPTRAMYVFFATYERGNPNPIKMHPQRRAKAAELANEMFNKDKIKADPKKWPSRAEGGGENGGNYSSGSSSNLSTSGHGDWYIFEQIPTTPLDEWNYWIGNHQGERIGYALLMIVFAIVGSIGPFIFALLSSVYGLGLTILAILSPIFLLFGCWGGRGNTIMIQYFGTILNTFIRKIVVSALLVFSILIVTATFEMLNKVGFFKSFMFLLITTVALIKNRDKILSKLSRLNIPQFDTSKSSQATSKVINKATKTASTLSKIGASSVIGGLAAKKEDGQFTKGAKVSAKETLKNQLYRTELGRNALMTYRSNVKGETGQKLLQMRVCVDCGTKLKEGEVYYLDSYQNAYCEMCASTKGYDDMTMNEIDNSEENEKAPITTDKHPTAREINIGTKQEPHYKQTKHLTYQEVNKKFKIHEITKATEWTKIEPKLLERIKESIAIVDDDIQNAKELNQPLETYFIPEPLRNIVSVEQIRESVENNDTETYKSVLVNGWLQWLELQGSKVGVDTTQSKADIKSYADEER